ncbi:MAG: hypothetical protein M3065_13810 [Actinomycetota bacterium]|nr:hypothetical protein [Actinomycetota bacterium]
MSEAAAPISEPAADATPNPAPTPTLEAPARSAPWPDWLRDAAVSLCRWLTRPRVRLTVIGAVLLLVGALFVTSSVWTLPLVIAGALMVVVAWVGHRLDGRLAVEWGETGAQFEFRAQIRAPEHAHPALAHVPARAHSLDPASEPEPEDAEVVEGEAHTVEIEVAELKALIAAAETAEAEAAQSEVSAQATRILRVAHGSSRSSDTAG